MSNHEYRNDNEREQTQKYEGVYTTEEIELNKQLYSECTKDNVNYEKVEELLKLGADPLGGTEEFGFDLLEHIYGEMVCDFVYSNSGPLPKLTKLFLKYGMNIDNPRIPYDCTESLNPLWNFAFLTNEYSTQALKLLLDNGLSADSFGNFWGHSFGDFFNCSCDDPQNDEFWNDACVWSLKMLLLGASYDHILNNDDDLNDFICCDYNSGNVKIFRNWNDFEYEFDTSHCEKKPELYGSIVHIYSKSSKEEVWTIGVGELGREALANMR